MRRGSWVGHKLSSNKVRLLESLMLWSLWSWGSLVDWCWDLSEMAGEERSEDQGRVQFSVNWTLWPRSEKSQGREGPSRRQLGVESSVCSTRTSFSFDLKKER
jgi:hypothetical protein